jgi:transcriptional regulator with XRE-family HTH domain
MTGPAVRVNQVRLRHEMVRRGWQANDLARAASVSAGTLTAILHGRSVSPHTLRKLAIALTKHPIVPGLEELIDLDGLEVGGGTSLTA